MSTLKRLSVAMSIVTAGLVAVACTSPTEAEIAQPADEPEVASDDGEDVVEDVETSSSALPVDDGAIPSDEVQLDDEAVLRHGGGRRHCDYRDEFHCRRHHRGWRWVSYGRGGYIGDRDRDYRDHRDSRRGRREDRCCVRYRGGWHR